jgi:hypothetical protein
MAITLQIIDGDIVVGAHTGQAKTIQGRDATRQHIAENMSIEVQPSGFGAGVDQLVGTVAVDPMTLQLLFSERVRNSFVIMRALQKATPDIPRATNEVIFGTRAIQIVQQPSDQRNYVYEIAVLTEAGLALLVSN